MSVWRDHRGMTERPLRATVSQRGVVFAPDDEVLLVRRRTDGGWELPGGRLDRDEGARAGVRREIIEETGIDPELGQPVHAISWLNDADDGRFAVYYYCRTDERSVTLSHEHTDFQWRSPAAAHDQLSDTQARAVANAVAAADDLDVGELGVPAPEM
jgi:8-oxo-dGTP pyrophosphatase MutT (NUDIX family)